jgi:prepilin-type N-terminal cleavage/methylation domain-containing protein
MSRQSGFTLVELSIVMVLIGILIGGILKGQELIRRSQINGTIAQMKSYMAGHHAFFDKYNGYPGDIAQASQRIPGCNGTNFCTNGDGDHKIGGSAFANFGRDQTGTAVPMSETTQFWKHLALAGFITGINTSADPANYAWGSTHPSTKAGGGFTALYLPPSGLPANPAGGINAGFHGNMLRIQENLQPAGGTNFFGMVLTPAEAFEIDSRLDDGQSQAGKVQSEGTFCGDNQYNMTSYSPCIVYYIF